MKTNTLTARSLFVSSLLLFAASSDADLTVQSSWQTFASTDGSILTKRHEAASVVHGSHVYLLGGRSSRPLERYSVTTGQWENLGPAPLELHHMQPVVLNSKIYILGAFTCCYPREDIVSEIHVFDIPTETWDVVGSLPSNRVRGSAAAVVHQGKIYLIGGNTDGHDGGAVPWFDEYDPQTGVWSELPDAPNARDHFSAVMVGDQLVAAAGRQTSLPSPAAGPVLVTDIYDFNLGQWRTGASIPTARAGVVSVAHDGHVIVAGGEINTSADALNVVEAYDVEDNTWQALPVMTSGRHGSGGGVVASHFYMLSGAPTIGGASELSNGERLALPDIVIPEVVDPEVVDPEVVDPEIVDPEVVDPETDITQKSSRGGGGSGLLLIAGLFGIRALRKSVS